MTLSAELRAPGFPAHQRGKLNDLFDHGLALVREIRLRARLQRCQEQGQLD